MKTLYQSILGASLLLSVTMAGAQQLSWEMKYPAMPGVVGQHQRHADQVRELPDSTILLLGHEQSYVDLKKLDKHGEIQWTRYFQPDTGGVINHELTIKTFEVLDNGHILLTGEKLDIGVPALAYLRLLDENGQDLFDTIYYGYTYLMKPWCSAKAADGVLIGGYKPDFQANEQYAMAMKVDSDFVKQWEYVLPVDSGGRYSEFMKMIANPDGTFDCFGQTRFGTSGPMQLLFVRLNASGTRIFAKTYPDTLGFIQISGACGGQGWRAMLAMNGNTHGYCYHIVKVDANGNKVWTRMYPCTDSVSILTYGMGRNSDEGFLVTGQTYYYDVNRMPYSSGIYLAKIDSAGNTAWNAEYGMHYTEQQTPWSTFEYGIDAVEAMDGSYLLAASDNADTIIAPLMSLLKVREGYTGIRPAGKATAARLWPNPFSSSATLEIPASMNSDGTLFIHSLTGQVVRSQPIHPGRTVISRGNLPDGIYFYEISSAGVVQFRGKMVVE